MFSTGDHQKFFTHYHHVWTVASLIAVLLCLFFLALHVVGLFRSGVQVGQLRQQLVSANSELEKAEKKLSLYEEARTQSLVTFAREIQKSQYDTLIAAIDNAGLGTVPYTNDDATFTRTSSTIVRVVEASLTTFEEKELWKKLINEMAPRLKSAKDTTRSLLFLLNEKRQASAKVQKNLEDTQLALRRLPTRSPSAQRLRAHQMETQRGLASLKTEIVSLRGQLLQQREKLLSELKGQSVE